MFAKVRKEADSELSSVAKGGVERWWCLCLLGVQVIGAGGTGLN